MKKFLALYMAPAALIEEWSNSPAEDQTKERAEWMRWAKSHKGDLVELGTPLGKNVKVTAGGMIDSKNEVCGYSIVQADSQEDATKIFASNPHLRQAGAWVDILVCGEM